MIKLQEYVDFVELERQQKLVGIQERSMLSNNALAWLGYAVNNLTILKMNSCEVEMGCAINNSRLRPGDKVLLSNEKHGSFTATLYDVKESGKKLCLSETNLYKHPKLLKTSGWLAMENYNDMAFSVQTALRNLKPGAPGWSFYNYLQGVLPLPFAQPLPELESIYGEVAKELEIFLDKTKQAALLNCFALPPVYGIQGPPGTGKTYLLAYLAEILLRAGKRVVILAPTHQAVNNALSIVKKLFPGRDVKKYGDELRKETLAKDIPIITRPKAIKNERSDTLLGMTFMAALHHLMVKKTIMLVPHVVIIDEAGQLPLTQGLCVGLSGAGSIILFGDDRQMPPVFAGELADDYRAVSLFAQLRANQPGAITLLDVTYRLNEQLCEAISGTFYKGEDLSSHEHAKYRVLRLEEPKTKLTPSVEQALLPEKPLIWLQVASNNCKQINHSEAQIAAEIAINCLKRGVDASNMVVVAPFRRQVMRIRQLIAEQVGDACNLPVVDTVERAQGLSVEIVIVSMCASDLDYIQSVAEFLYSPNRMNVAISRARTKAIVISSPNIFDVTPNSYIGLLARDLCRNLLKSKTCHAVSS